MLDLDGSITLQTSRLEDTGTGTGQVQRVLSSHNTEKSSYDISLLLPNAFSDQEPLFFILRKVST